MKLTTWLNTPVPYKKRRWNVIVSIALGLFAAHIREDRFKAIERRLARVENEDEARRKLAREILDSIPKPKQSSSSGLDPL